MFNKAFISTTLAVALGWVAGQFLSSMLLGNKG